MKTNLNLVTFNIGTSIQLNIYCTSFNTIQFGKYSRNMTHIEENKFLE